MQREKVIVEMKLVFQKIPYGIDHTLRVLANADEIMKRECVDDNTAEIITYAAILHDIGAVMALEKYGSIEGHYQEIEGPAVAKDILARSGVDSEIIERVGYIIGNHHTPTKIDNLDFQILWEADVLDSLEFGEKESDIGHIKEKVESSFRTISGKELALKHLGLME